MTRGKAAAQSARRREEQARQELRELQEQFAAFRDEAKRRETELLDELQRTKNRLVHEVDALAADAVRRAETRVEEVRVEEREAAEQRVIAGFKLLYVYSAPHGGVRVMPDDAARIAETLGVPVASMLDNELRDDFRPSRHTRRVTSGSLRKTMARLADPKYAPRNADIGVAQNVTRPCGPSEVREIVGG